MQYQLPIGIYDINQLSGNIQLNIASEADQYAGLNGRINKLENLIVSADDKGPFGSPFVDSERAAVSEATKNALQIIYHRPSENLADRKSVV